MARPSTWSYVDRTEHAEEWTAEIEFRATGPERGGGNMQVWYSQERHGIASVYTVGKFDGLVLIIDTYGGSGGSIRGFLNDGSMDYHSHHNVDALAFGHCHYAYRNLGRHSRLRIKSSATSFEVTVDDKDCFKTDRIKLPSGYYFGLSAASAETPDSFEAFKFVVRSSRQQSTPPPPPPVSPSQPQPHGQAQGQGQSHPQAGAHSGSGSGSSGSGSAGLAADQFAELQRQLHAVTEQLARAHTQLSELATAAADARRAASERAASLASLGARAAALEDGMRAVQRELHDARGLRDTMAQLQRSMSESHATLMTHLPASISHVVHTAAPRLRVFAALVIAFQLLLAAAYVVYKRRRAGAPKKYL